MNKKYLLLLLVAIAVVGTIAIAAIEKTTQLVGTHKSSAHLHQIQEELDDIVSLLKDAETGQRGYLLTGKDSYLEPYLAATAQIDKHLQHFKELTKDDATLQIRLKELEPLIVQKLDELEQTVVLRKTKGFDAAMKIVQTDKGKDLMNEIRKLTTGIDKEEGELLVNQDNESVSASSQVLGITICLISVALLLIAWNTFFMKMVLSR